MREADTHLGQLVNMLRAPGVATLPGAVAIVAVKAAGSIAQQRPFFMNKILPVLIALGSAQVRFPHTALQCFDGGMYRHCIVSLGVSRQCILRQMPTE